MSTRLAWQHDDVFVDCNSDLLRWPGGMDMEMPTAAPKGRAPKAKSSVGRGQKKTERYSSSYQCISHLPAPRPAYKFTLNEYRPSCAVQSCAQLRINTCARGFRGRSQASSPPSFSTNVTGSNFWLTFTSCMDFCRMIGCQGGWGLMSARSSFHHDLFQPCFPNVALTLPLQLRH